jgi:acetylornithine deacetylase/succinyl-diaminopimelate desuccinylase-like protein
MNRLEKFQNDGIIAEEAIKLLQKSIQFETINPPGNEIILAEYYKQFLDSFNFQNISYKIITTGSSRGNLIITYKGTENDNRPIWGFGSHLDVVPPGPEELWDHPPFSGDLVKHENDNFIYGRGAMDMKYVGVSLLIAMITHLREGFLPKGDIRFIFESDEETSGYNGILPLIKNHWDEIKLDYFITEGAGFKLPIGPNTYSISVAEKGKSIIKLTAFGKTGHGSAPGDYSTYAIFHLMKFLKKLRKHKPEVIITKEHCYMIDNLPIPGFIKFILKKKVGIKITLGLLGIFGSTNTKNKLIGFVSTSIAPTILKAGEKENVISPDGSLIMDIRMLPGQDNKDVVNLLKKIAGKKLMKHLKIEEIDFVPPARSPIDTPAFKIIQDTLDDFDKDNALVPIVLPAGTDGRRFRMNGQIAYGFCMSNIDKDISFNELFSLPHSPNERISVTNLMLCTEFFYRIMKKL